MRSGHDPFKVLGVITRELWWLRTEKEGCSQDVLYGRGINKKKIGSKKGKIRGSDNIIMKILNRNKWYHCPENEEPKIKPRS